MKPDVVAYICYNCVPEAGRLPHQWVQDGVHVMVREVPCTGKIDCQYLFHALEAGARGICVVTCPKGECGLGQGNYRAEVRVKTVRRLLGEIGIEPERAELLRCSPDDPSEHLRETVREAARRLGDLGESPVRSNNSEKAKS